CIQSPTSQVQDIELAMVSQRVSRAFATTWQLLAPHVAGPHRRGTVTVCGTCSISASCSHLARRLAGPALVCMRECAHLTKAKHPRNLGYVQLAIIEVTNRQIAPKLLKYFSEVQSFVRKPSCKRPLAHSQTASDIFHEYFSMRKHRRDRVLNLRAQLAR